MNYLTECLIKFQSLPAAIKEAFGSIETYADIKEIEDEYNVKLSFLVILIAINELEEDDLEDYLIIKFKISPLIAKHLKEKLVSKVLDKIFNKIIANKPLTDFNFTRDDLVNLFSRRVIETLGASPDVAKGLNIVIFKILNTDDSLEEKSINLLYNNDEILTTNSITIDEKGVSPTVSNWLKDFIKINGSEMFDELKMAEYLSSSVNAKKLKQSEKDLLRKLLKLYRNLAFFPDSMGNDPIEDWQIIPVDKIETNKKVSKLGVFRDALDDSQPIDKKKLEDIPLNELQEALTQYAPSSLEYKAVKQEIEHLKKKK